MEVKTGFIDPKDYPFKYLIDEQKHLDTDELRHTIKPVKVNIASLVGKEHLYCDPAQLDAEGKYRRPKKLMEAERRGFKSVIEMDQADKKAAEDAKTKIIEDQRRTIEEQAGHIETLSVRSKGLEDHARLLEKDLVDYKTLTEARFDKLVALIQVSK